MAKVDRVECIAMPDAQTAVNALQSGEIDFMESVPIDMLPVLHQNSDIKLETLIKAGFQTGGRMNFYRFARRRKPPDCTIYQNRMGLHWIVPPIMYPNHDCIRRIVVEVIQLTG